MDSSKLYYYWKPKQEVSNTQPVSVCTQPKDVFACETIVTKILMFRFDNSSKNWAALTQIWPQLRNAPRAINTYQPYETSINFLHKQFNITSY